jgi:tripartite-type tricarboxylate transporter receptor subunit TctC
MRALWVLAVLLPALLPLAAAAQPVADFYAKTRLVVMVSFPPGDTYDLYGRLVAKAIVKYIPGSPSYVVENQAGAGGRTLANQLYGASPRDGSVLGLVNQGVPTDEALDQPGVRLKSKEFAWIGSPYTPVNVIFAWHTAPVMRFEDLLTHELIVGATGPSSPNFIYARILNGVLGTHFRIISGYPGTGELNQGIEHGEIEGRVGVSWTSVKNSSDWVASGKVRILAQIGLARDPDLPNVPLLHEFATNAADRRLLEFMSYSTAMGRPFLVPPGVPPERVAALRRAFDRAMQDPELLAEAQKARLDIAPMSGEALQELVAKTVDTPADIRTRARRDGALIKKPSSPRGRGRIF